MTPAVRNILALLVASALVSLGGVSSVLDNDPQIVSSGDGGALTFEGPGADGAGTVTRTVGGRAGSAGSAGSAGGQASDGQGGAGSAGSETGECAAGRNGGKTDRGVSEGRIGLGSTIVTSGPGATFLSQSQFGMLAIVAKVNKAKGNICGRQLDLKLVNDGWEAQRGQQFLRNFVNDEGIFALPVVPSSEGLAAAGPEIEQAGIPVVGSDGMRVDQYRNKWIWPVATATVSQMRIAVDFVKSQDPNAKRFAIVYDTRYKFGVEGAAAFACYIDGSKIDSSYDCKGSGLGNGYELVVAKGIEPNQPGYGTQIGQVDQACGDSCDVLMMLVDPGTANTWISGDSKFTSRTDYRMGGQPLFTNNFGQDCGQRCDGMYVLTGYVPPLEGNSNLPGVKEFIQDVKAINPGADTTNQFLEGAYLGMSVFVKALHQVGPNLTRAALQDVMNSMTYSSDLASELSWSTSKRKANTAAQVWEIKAGSGSFDGFRDTRSGWIQDPNPNAE